MIETSFQAAPHDHLFWAGITTGLSAGRVFGKLVYRNEPDRPWGELRAAALSGRALAWCYCISAKKRFNRCDNQR
ncbi:hypothetical protein [Bradyrhizobium sp. CCBAU 45384]|uniref:hypothetical protein n=1 Tax=Bradyrhizobium sp. CCBAU 45384 TaxID=858428 RepID=UPI002306B4DA|nr:hypothetical protein [Bradyrhizobium sp. CCBAU 45384]